MSLFSRDVLVRFFALRLVRAEDAWTPLWSPGPAVRRAPRNEISKEKKRWTAPHLLPRAASALADFSVSYLRCIIPYPPTSSSGAAVFSLRMCVVANYAEQRDRLRSGGACFLFNPSFMGP